MAVLAIEGVSKAYRQGFLMGRKEALRDLTLSVGEGEVFGFLGPNGAGKTTAIKIVLGLVHPDGGNVRIFDRPAGDPRSRERVGFLPENPNFFGHLTADEFLRFCGGLFGLRGLELENRVDGIVRRLDLGDARDRRLRTYSKGMLQRVGLGQVLVNDPDFLLLDEPFSGLDPLGRKAFRDILLELRGKGRTIFFSSHVLADMEVVCDRVGILKQGRMVRDLSLRQAMLLGGGVLEVRAADVSEGLFRRLGRTAERAERRQQEVLLVLPQGAPLRETVGAIHEGGGRLLSVIPQRPGLEEVFLREFGPESEREPEGATAEAGPAARSGRPDAEGARGPSPGRTQPARFSDREPIIPPETGDPGGLGGSIPSGVEYGRPERSSDARSTHRGRSRKGSKEGIER
jgi:ABC-2 type transport system ATP-binding protein